MATAPSRGLFNFIQEIRACPNKEAERQRVDKELANIRVKFGKGERLTAYEKKKYVWKMLYIFMLGYDVEFGHTQALSLISARSYPEKQVGYIVTSILLNEHSDFLRLAINTVRNDLVGRNETFQCLALCLVANVGGLEFAEAMHADVARLLAGAQHRPVVRKKAALCLNRLFRRNADLVSAETLVPVIQSLLDERDLGLLLCAVTLLLSVCQLGHAAAFSAAAPKAIRLLERLRMETRGALEVTQDYMYYNLPCPWLQIKLLRVLQFWPPPEEESVRGALLNAAKRVLSADGGRRESVNKANAHNAVLFEGVALALHLGGNDPEILGLCTAILLKFVTAPEANGRYLGLESMARLAALPEMLAAVKSHSGDVTALLRDPDVSVRKRALAVLSTMADGGDAPAIVSELLRALPSSDLRMREELALAIAMLAERFALGADPAWYLDVMMTLLDAAGEFVPEDVWWRTAQAAANGGAQLQARAARKAHAALAAGGPLPESMVRASAYLLGEFGHRLAAEGGAGAPALWRLLQARWAGAAPPTRQLLSTAGAKLLARCPAPPPAFAASVKAALSTRATALDAELQQRSVEFLSLMARVPASLGRALAPMPRYPERGSALLRRGAAGVREANEALPPSLRRPLPEESVVRGIDDGDDVTDDVMDNGIGDGDVGGKGGAGARSGAHPPAPAPPPLSDLLGLDAHPPTAPTAAAAPPPPRDIFSMLGELSGALPAALPPPEPPLYLESGTENHGLENAGLDHGLGDGGAYPAAAPANPFAAEYSGEYSGAGGEYSGAGGEYSGGEYANGAAPPHTQSLSPAPLRDPAAWHDALCTTTDGGLLYEDEYLQVGLRAAYEGPGGTLSLYLGNKAGSAMTDVALGVQGLPPCLTAVLVGQDPESEPALSIASHQQAKVSVDVECTGRYDGTPPLGLEYTLDGRHAVVKSLRLPVPWVKFLSPVPDLAPEAFFGLWKALAGSGHRTSAVARTVEPLDALRLAGVATGLHLDVKPFDPSPANVAAAAVLPPESPDSSPVPILARLESDVASMRQFRVTVACADAGAGAALRAMLVAAIERAGAGEEAGV